MIIRTRPRRMAMLFAFHAFAWSATGYFLLSAQTGERGLVAKREAKAKMVETAAKIADLKIERLGWERRVGQLSGLKVDRDLIDERQREMLGIVHKNDIVILVDTSQSRK